MNDKTAELNNRQPIVVVLGHIDHGKTTLLDNIRKTNVAGGESGGITQHMGAYEIEHTNKEGERKKITFLDTPGHEAFGLMRSRGAKVADVGILVVAADEGVKPQTVEALKTINEAKLPYILVLNKIDKDSADPERVKKELADKGILFEDWGGSIPICKVSAKSGEGVSDLLEMILLVYELEAQNGNFDKPAAGVVIESHLDQRRGNAATLLLTLGTLKKGDFILAGDARAKVRILEDFKGSAKNEIFAGSPARVVGFDNIPAVGTEFAVYNSERSMDEARMAKKDFQNVREISGLEHNDIKVISVVIKADTAGSIEAIEHELGKLKSDKFFMKIIRREVGNIGENDVKFASGAKGTLLIGFRVKTDANSEELALKLQVSLKVFSVIYELSDWAKLEIENQLPRTSERVALGLARVLKIFKIDGKKQIVGGKVETGKIIDGAKLTLKRREFSLNECRILELQSGKSKVKEVSEGQEFGVMLESAAEIVPGDQLEIFEEVIRQPKL